MTPENFLSIVTFIFGVFYLFFGFFEDPIFLLTAPAFFWISLSFQMIGKKR